MSADTLRRLVELARIKEQRREEADAAERDGRYSSPHHHPHHNAHGLSRGKSLAGGLSPREPEEIVKKRMSVTDPNHMPPIRSFSLPKGSLLPDKPDHGRLESHDSTGSAFSDYAPQVSDPELQIPRHADERRLDSKKRDSKTVSASYSTSYTQSQSRSSNIPHQQYYQLKETRPGEYRKEINASYATSNTQDSRLPPPILDNISEASGYTVGSNYWGDSLPQSTRSEINPYQHQKGARASLSDIHDHTQEPVMTPPSSMGSGGGGGDGGGGGLFSCFPCLRKSTGRELQQLRSHTNLDHEHEVVRSRTGDVDEIVGSIEMKAREERPVGSAQSSSMKLPPALDQLTATTVSRLRRPTAFSQRTINVDDTMTELDVRMWNEPFGRGASGRVYKAIHLPTCTLIACKVTSSLSKDTIRQLLEECRAQTERLPDIDQFLKILGWYRDQSTNDFVIVLEYMDLGSVFDSCFLDSPAAEEARHKESGEDYTHEEVNNSGHKQVFVSKLNYDQIRHIARETLLALKVLHEQEKPLIHRDIKPQNILIASTGEVKLADFGLLYQLKSPEAVCKDSKGTRKYFSPERIDCEFGVGSDIWAFGVTMIEIYQQKLISPHLLNDFKIQGGLQPTEFLGTTVPTEFVSFIGACLQKNPLKRPPAQILLTHPYIKGTWGIPTISSGPSSLQSSGPKVRFLQAEPDHGLLDTFLTWLEEWILEDDEQNATLFLEGADEDLSSCLENISKWTGFGTLYIETLITEQYREFVNSV